MVGFYISYMLSLALIYIGEVLYAALSDKEPWDLWSRMVNNRIFQSDHPERLVKKIFYVAGSLFFVTSLVILVWSVAADRGHPRAVYGGIVLLAGIIQVFSFGSLCAVTYRKVSESAHPPLPPKETERIFKDRE